MIQPEDVDKLKEMSIEDLAEEYKLAQDYTIKVKEFYQERIRGIGIPLPANLNSGIKKKYNVPTHCIMDGCSKVHGGPKSGWFCNDHLNADQSSKALAKRNYKLKHTSK